MLNKDCELSSSQSHFSPQVIDVDGQETEVVVRRFVCAGVKVCGAPDCEYTVFTAQRINRCKLHKKTHGLCKSEQCPVSIVHVKPEEDYGRRWVGTLTLQGATQCHNHAKPSPRKLPVSVADDLKQAVLLDPSKRLRIYKKVDNNQLSSLSQDVLALLHWSNAGAVVRALASHQCGQGSSPEREAIRGLTLVLVLPERFFRWHSGLLLSLKNIFKFQFDQER